jgi:hypothetical protein
VDLDGGHHARLQALALERVGERQTVDHGAQHAHVVGAGAVRTELGELGAAQDVAATDHDRALGPQRRHARHLAGDDLHALGVDAMAGLGISQGFARELEQDALVRGGHAGSGV